MSHSVSVFIAGEPAIRKLSAALGNAPFHHIRNDGWFFLPVTDEVFDLATSLKGDSDPVRDGYYRFSKSLALIAGDDAPTPARLPTSSPITSAAKEPRAPPSGKRARSSFNPTSTASAPSTPPSAPSASRQSPPWMSSTPSAWEA
jgi:hypothetical protein